MAFAVLLTRICPQSRMRLLLLTMLFACSLSSVMPAEGQRDFTRIYGSEDQEIPTPAFVGTLGQKDAAALQELIDYVKTVNITTWKGLQSAGMLSDASDVSYQATLTILHGDHVRLDVQTAKGERSTRISDSYGKTLEVDGKGFFMPPATAKAGLFAFPRLLTSTFPDSNTSFIDRGQVKIDGKSLHRITVEESVIAGKIDTDQRDIAVTDLYFDTATHLLLKSASAVQLDSADRQKYLVAVTYDDYQKIQNSLVPYRYSQSLNGQHQWTLQLSGVDLQPSVDISYFTF